MDDRIERRVTIRAPLGRVWSMVTTPGWWLPGSPGRVAGWGQERHPWIIDVVAVEPQGYVSFRWASAFGGLAPGQGTSTLLEFYLRQLGDAAGATGAAGAPGAAGTAGEVIVTVVESGFASLDLPTALRDDQRTASDGAWQYELSWLRARAEQGEPARNETVSGGGRQMAGR